MELNMTEIQYLRGLVWVDKIENDYISRQDTKIDRSMTMHEFTENILNKLDEKENS